MHCFVIGGDNCAPLHFFFFFSFSIEIFYTQVVYVCTCMCVCVTGCIKCYSSIGLESQLTLTGQYRVSMA